MTCRSAGGGLWGGPESGGRRGAGRIAAQWHHHEHGIPAATHYREHCRAGNGYLRPNNNRKRGRLSASVVERLDRYFDTSVFSQPVPCTFGNTGRLLPDIRRPGVTNWDFSVFKNFSVGQQLALQVRGEFFHFTNAPVSW